MEKTLTSGISCSLPSTKTKIDKETSALDSPLHAVEQSTEVVNDGSKTIIMDLAKLNCSFEICQSEVAVLQNKSLNITNIKLITNEINIFEVAKNLPDINNVPDASYIRNSKAKVNCTINIPNLIITAVCDRWKKDPKSHMDINICIPAMKSSNVRVFVTDSTVFGSPDLTIFINKTLNSAVKSEAAQPQIVFSYPEDYCKSLINTHPSLTHTDILKTKPTIEIISMDNIIPQSSVNNATVALPHKHVAKEIQSLPQQQKGCDNILPFSYKLMDGDNFDTNKNHVFTTQPLYRGDAYRRSDLHDQSVYSKFYSSSTHLEPQMFSPNRSYDARNVAYEDDSECSCLYTCCSFCSLIIDLLDCLLTCARWDN